MICVTGDMHGDLSRFNDKNIRKLRKGDYLVICGDFGFLWNGSSRERSAIKSIGKKSFTTLFVDGCHENYDMIEEYPVEEWNGGLARNISGRLYRLERGCIYQLGEQKVFAFGGGQSDDADIRRESHTWWHQESPTQDEVNRALENLEAVGGNVDFIFSHEAPLSLMELLHIRRPSISEASAFLDIVRRNYRFKKWFFGKCHINKQIPPQFYAIFNESIILQ